MTIVHDKRHLDPDWERWAQKGLAQESVYSLRFVYLFTQADREKERQMLAGKSDEERAQLEADIVNARDDFMKRVAERVASTFICYNFDPNEEPARFDDVRWELYFWCNHFQDCPGRRDYDKPVDEEGEQYETYFLGVVDEADLLAALEETGGELPACTCAEKCAAGAVNTDCPVCAANMTECVGLEPEPEPTEEPEPEPEQEAGFPAGTLLLALAVVVIGGGAGWYFKIYRPKQEQAAAQAEEDYSDEPDPYDDPEEDYDPYGGDEYDEDKETEGRS